MSATLYLVRHGRAAAGWDVDPDPGLDDVGRAQAEAAAVTLAPLGPLAIVTSPYRRTRETAAPLAKRWAVEPVPDPEVGELPSPPGVPMAERTRWLRWAIGATWDDLGEPYASWRDGVVAHVRRFTTDTVVFTHFMAINVVVAAATTGSPGPPERAVVFAPGNASITRVRCDRGDLHVEALGAADPASLVRQT